MTETASAPYRLRMHCYNVYNAMWLVGGVALLAIMTGIVTAILANKAGRVH